MNSRLVLTVLVSLCMLSYGQSMKVHTKGGTTPASYSLSTIDSITFELSSKANIVFQTDRAGTSTQQIWMVKSDGTGLKALTTAGETYKYWPRWSPDGSKIAYNACNVYNGNYVIKVIDTAGTLIKTISTASNIGVHGLTWSADGQWLYYAQNIVCGEQMRKINYVNNSLDSLIISSLSSVMPQDIDRSGSGLLLFHRYQCATNTYFGIFNTSTKAVSTGVAFNSAYSSSCPRWSLDGTMIVYTQSTSTTPYPSRAYIVNSNGTNNHAVSSTMNIGHTVFAFGGTKLVVSRSKSDEPSATVRNLWLVNIDGSNPVQITTGDYSDQYIDVQ